MNRIWCKIRPWILAHGLTVAVTTAVTSLLFITTIAVVTSTDRDRAARAACRAARDSSGAVQVALQEAVASGPRAKDPATLVFFDHLTIQLDQAYKDCLNHTRSN